MKKLPYTLQGPRYGDQTIPKATLAFSSSAYLGVGEDAADALTEDIMQAIGTDVTLTIGGVTAFLCAWLDPDHWADDWREELGCDHDEVATRVAEIIEEAIEDD